MADSFLIHDEKVEGPATHALVIGVGDYPHLNGGSAKLSKHHDQMGQLTSPPVSAREFASWILSSEFNHPNKPLASVALLLSEAKPKPFVGPGKKKHKVGLADFANVEQSVSEFFERGDTDTGNLMVFYFCGHGISQGTDTALLLSDYGAKKNPLLGALDFREFRLGMEACKAGEQVFFVDACRQSSDTLLNRSKDDTFSGQVVLLSEPRPFEAGQLRAPVFYATVNDAKAFARPDKSTVFTESLLLALRDLAADKSEGDWRISTLGLQKALGHLVDRRARDLNKKQVPTGDSMLQVFLNYLTDTPDALVYLKSEPKEAIGTADSVTFRIGNGPATKAPATGRSAEEWAFQVTSGNYDFDVTFPAKPPFKVSEFVMPPFQVVKVKAP